MNVASFFEKQRKPFWVILAVAFVIVLGIMDFLTSYEITFSLFYLIPIFMVAWYTDGRMGLVLSSASAISWFIADFTSGLVYSDPSIYVWNAILRLGFYTAFSWLSSTLKKSYKINQELARTDFVTGAVSIRYFYELAKIEINRSQRYRHPFSLVYIDLDNFKIINDRLGHSTGDRLLRAVTDSIHRQVRLTDTLARLGGDEFALLLPETDGEEAKMVIAKIHASLVNEMLQNSWMVTFSVGVVTYKKAPKTVDDMIKMADSAMYSIKNTSKNGVCYRIYTG
jgi:diguanylate cyclase (GGDEF)-like protein